MMTNNNNVDDCALMNGLIFNKFPIIFSLNPNSRTGIECIYSSEKISDKKKISIDRDLQEGQFLMRLKLKLKSFILHKIFLKNVLCSYFSPFPQSYFYFTTICTAIKKPFFCSA